MESRHHVTYTSPTSKDSLIKNLRDEIESLTNEIHARDDEIAQLTVTNTILHHSVKALQSNPKKLRAFLGNDDKTSEQYSRKMGEVKPIVNEFILPYCKFQSDSDLFDFGPNTIGETIMNKLEIEDDLETRSNYWCSVYLIVKKIMKQHRGYVTWIVKKKL